MYKDLENALAEHDSSSKSLLSISKSSNLGLILGLKDARLVEANYPEFDILDLSLGDREFDFVVSDQVLEHVSDPFRAFSESRRVVKPGGLVIHTTCFMNLIHQHPTDYWRFTPSALVELAERVGLEVVRVGGWGNREAWFYLNLGYRKAKIPEDEDNPLYKLAMKNEGKFPIVTWLIARRPDEPPHSSEKLDEAGYLGSESVEVMRDNGVNEQRRERGGGRIERAIRSLLEHARRSDRG